ncbi:protein kinase [Streptomyces sp. NPDC048337]|uniref:protein kinase n=1 Tax=Streptomyces sp. NPDC048337 TaxID=3365535 RepID=UPI00371FCEB0
MEEYAGRILAHRYRLPLPPTDEYELIETRAFDTRSGQEVLVRQVPLPEVVDAELVDGSRAVPSAGRRDPADLPAVRRAIEAAQAAAAVPDHPRLDQVFDVFAEDGSLWIVSELVPARPLAALIADEPLSPYRAAEVASDVLTALRVLHAHGWTHRNITVRTVLVCEDGRVVLTGLAAGAAEEALCGYDPLPGRDASGGDGGWGSSPAGSPAAGPAVPPARGSAEWSGAAAAPVEAGALGGDPGASGAGSGVFGSDGSRAGDDGGPAYAPLVAPGYDTGPRYNDHITPGRPEERPDLKAAARAGAIAAYRAGARAAAAKVTEQRKSGSDPIVVPEPPRPAGSTLPQGYSYPYGNPETGDPVPWHGATPRRPDLSDPEQPAPADPPGATAQPQPGPWPELEPRPAGSPGPGARRGTSSGAERGQGADSESGTAFGALRGHPGAHPAPAALTPGGPGQPAEGSGRPALPAQLALPQGYRQADEVPAVAARYAPVQPSGLGAERARQTRMAVVGAVTERWAPEQARSLSGPWQLAAPIGPATDLWALGALLYRAVQGHAPYPEDSVAELVETVCAEPPAFAEECGALRPVVESLLRQDPTERPDFEELRGWLRSLVRSAPEPEAAPLPEPDPARLPVVRRRGDLHGRHRNPAAPRKPRALGRTLLVGILVLLSGAVAYALLFMPRSGTPEAESKNTPAGSSAKSPSQSQSPKPGPSPSRAPSGTGTPESNPAPQTTAPAASAPPGYTTQQDPEHFEIAVPDGWERRGINEAGQVRYTDGQFVLTVVPGRDKVQGNPDPAAYQKDKEPELTPYRTSTWSTVGDIKTTKVGQQLRATGRYTWIDGTGRNVFARNFVVALGGSYHVVMVTGPEDEQGKVTEVFEKATASYKSGG